MFSGSEYHWIERRRMVSGLARLWQRLQDWLNHLSDANPTGFNIVVALLVVVLVALLVHIGYVMWHIVRPAARGGTRASASATGFIMDARAHLARAEDLAGAGRYAEALAHCFVAAVLELDRRKALRFHASKTPAEYVGEARLDETGRVALAGLVARLYGHLFGAVPCDEYEYRSFGQAALELARGRHVVST